MTTVSSPFLDGVAQRWQEFIRRPEFGGVQYSVNLDRSIGKLVIEFWCQSHVGSVGAWENAHCLDVDLLDMGTKQGSMLSIGPCTDDSEVQARIEALRSFLHGAVRSERP